MLSNYEKQNEWWGRLSVNYEIVIIEAIFYRISKWSDLIEFILFMYIALLP